MFLGLLAYDWFRVLIWFDHMGLRVATLVNLSFIGGDLGDERGRPLDRPWRPRPRRAGCAATVRDLGAAADPVLHPARCRVGPCLGRGRAAACGGRPEPAAAGGDGAARLRPVRGRGGAGAAIVARWRGRAVGRAHGGGRRTGLVARPAVRAQQRRLHAGSSPPTGEASAAPGGSGIGRRNST